MMHANFFYGFFMVPLFLMMQSITATIRHETDVFGKWHAWQQIYNDRHIADLCNKDDNKILADVSTNYQQAIIPLKPLTQLLSSITHNLIQSDGYQLAPPLDPDMKNNLIYLFKTSDSDIPRFIECLINHGIVNNENIKSEEAIDHLVTIEKYKALTRVLFGQDDYFKENEYSFALGNRLFEYCYSHETFPHYQQILTDASKFPVARFINSILWYQLVGDGWKNWHAQTIQNLKEKADAGNEIVYIAGGTDIYHLLRMGIYNITVIDPFLPSQNRYYSEGWDYLVSEQVCGDEIRFGPSCNSIKMKCENYQTFDLFNYKLSNGTIFSAKKADITWNIYDRDNNKIGRVLFARRPATQDDFQDMQHKTFVMSYDEMTYIAVPEMLQGWNIDAPQLSDNLVMYVKQCRKPVDKSMLLHIRIAALLNFADLKFINFASNPT